MDFFNYKNGQLYAENLAVADIAAEFGTPCYIYSRATLERHWHAYDQAFGDQAHQICYAVKANSNLAVLNLFARLGSGFDIVSQGELDRVLAAGGDPKKTVFSGVGKTAAEIRYALEVGIGCFNAESEAELIRINDIAADMGLKAAISIRVNPDVDAQTHPYISTGLKENKFGIDIQRAVDVYQHAATLHNLDIIGVDCHIGSQLTQIAPFVDALRRVLVLVDQLAEVGINLHHIDVGGGLGIRYENENPPEPAELTTAIIDTLQGREVKVLMEPGRSIAGNAGLLLTKVEYIKLAHDNDGKNFAIVDAAMNDLARPSLYGAWQDIITVEESPNKEEQLYDVVGPVCETGDFLGKERKLAIAQDDLLAIRSSGAYGFTMSSNYNSRPRVAEVIVDGTTAHEVRARETIASLMMGEKILP